MGIFDFLRPRAEGESTLTEPQEWLQAAFGRALSPEEALKVVACYACVRVISEQVATLPLNVYRKTDQGREKVEDDLYRLLNVEPNPYMTAYNFWRVMMVNLLLTGHAYAEIQRQRKDKAPVALWPIPSKYIDRRQKSSGEPEYLATVKKENSEETKTVRIAYGNMLELVGLSQNGQKAFRPLELLADCLGLSRQAEAFATEYYANGSHPSGIITYPGTLRGEKRDAFKQDLMATYSGLGKRHRVMLLEEGMNYVRLAAPMTDGQTAETRKSQVIEVARFFNVPPHKIMEMDRATWGNIEELNISWVNDTLLPHLINIRQAVSQSLLFSFQKKDGLYVEHDLNTMLRGRINDRYNAYALARQWGWMSANDVRRRENMTEIGNQGDIYLTPLNMAGADEQSGGIDA